jgi:hypothetical protein
MRRKIIQHYADTLCQMFCGWQLMGDFSRLEHLGTGRLSINLLSGACAHKGKQVEQLSMARILQAWLHERCAKNAVPTDALSQIILEADLDIQQSDKQRDPSIRYSDATPPFIGCNIRCRSTIATDERTYEGQFTEFREWRRRSAGPMHKLNTGDWNNTTAGPIEVEDDDAS